MASAAIHVDADANGGGSLAVETGTSLSVNQGSEAQIGTPITPKTNPLAADPSSLTKNGAADTGSHAHFTGSTAATLDDGNAVGNHSAVAEAGDRKTASKPESLIPSTDDTAGKPEDSNRTGDSDTAGKPEDSNHTGDSDTAGKPEDSNRTGDSDTAAANKKKKEKLTPEQIRLAHRFAAWLALRYISMLYAVLTPLALWLSAGRPPAVVWTFSLITCSYLFLWTSFLTVTMHTSTVFFSISYVALVASTVAHLSPVTGMVIVHLDTAYAAGLFGYALAERRQHNGTDQSAGAVPIPSSRSKDEMKSDKDVVIMVSIYSTVASLVCVARATWVAWHSADTYWLIRELSLLLGFVLLWWIALVTMHMLHGALITESHLALIFLCGALLFLPECVVSFLFGEAIGTLVYSIGMMGVAGLFGYSLAVYARYKEMLTGRYPRPAKETA